LDGTQLLAAIQAQGKNIRAIIHTAYASFDSAKAALNLGAFAYVEKLSDPGELVRHVNRACREQFDRYADELEGRIGQRTADLLQANAQLKTEVQERRRAEAALQTAHADLEHRVQERTADLLRANEKLRTEVQERRRAEQALREDERLLRSLLSLHERERQLFAYEIHDGLVQFVTGALMRLESVFQREGFPPGKSRHEVEVSLELLRETVKEARRLISGLRPPILDEDGIVAAIEYLIREHGGSPLTIEFEHNVHFDRLAPILESALFRIVQEALSNARQHSQTQRVRVELHQQHDRLHLLVQDWGVGFQPELVTEQHFGLRGVRKRALLLGGAASVESRPGQGTQIRVELPLILPSDKSPAVVEEPAEDLA